jgi:hypothetical protein
MHPDSLLPKIFPENYENEGEFEYTEEIHVYRLLEMFSRHIEAEYPLHELGCPATTDFDPNSDPDDLWKPNSSPCCICSGFVQVRPAIICPCIQMTAKVAVEKTLRNMVEKEYISGEEAKILSVQLDII